MEIEDENRAKEYYLNSGVDGIHRPDTNTVELNYLDFLKLMDGYAKHANDSKLNVCGETIAKQQEVIDRYENWEANLIKDSECWEDAYPKMTEEIFEEFLEIQTLRNNLSSSVLNVKS